jgi:hypothetical protein
MDKEELKEQMKMIYEVLGDSDTGRVIAKMFRNLYLGLIKEGFTEEQALQIVRAFNASK